MAVKLSRVSYVRISGDSKADVISSVSRAMELVGWRKYVNGRSIFVKVNLLSDQLVPGQCTSPWVLEGVLSVLKETRAKIFVGDSDVATTRQVMRAAGVWGVLDICERFGARFVNLAEEKRGRVKVRGRIFDYIEIPKILAEVDSIVSVPVVKTHNVTKITCALKNQWGCIPRFRHNYHHVAGLAIPEINKALSVCFAVADATVSMEGSGPRVGIPKVTNSVFASSDIVAIDRVAADFIGIDYKSVEHIMRAEVLGLGSTNAVVVGDKLECQNFKPALIEKHPIVFVEMKLRKIPVVKQLVFETPLFMIPAWIAAKYNSFYWYNLKGRKYAREVVENHLLYGKEFRELMKNGK